ncbi:carbon-nitrogen hydrolase family protein [Actinoplanes subglobosus]|uniref:Carbon-nitrogen hydrolase family protein n=1 Tax=Actinoplanes subglobosus TaxID=1547892 RepID=A0ABV8IQQ6_9ACTN
MTADRNLKRRVRARAAKTGESYTAALRHFRTTPQGEPMRLSVTQLIVELREIRALAAELRLWTVLGSVHPLTPPRRPHLSLYVISDKGRIVTRYDERMLSNTKVSHMYTPGAAPVTCTVDGVRFGLALGMEATFPEVFLEYERLDVDCVLFSTHGPGVPFALQAQAHAAANSYWVSYAGTAQDAPNAPSGIVGPGGNWLARCAPSADYAVVTTDLDLAAENLARPWRRVARGGLYTSYQATDDPRSLDRAGS